MLAVGTGPQKALVQDLCRSTLQLEILASMIGIEVGLGFKKLN